jgi:PTH1 family peptidyl-tRNA hydrolase
MLLIVGLGNPGPEYRRHRHNVGFMAVDTIQTRHGFSPWRRRFRGEVAEGTLAGEKVLLLKPLTYMNESGSAVQEAAAFYKLAPKDIVVIHDEVDLPPGKTRMKAGGGAAGHNGLRSIKEAVPHYVLHDFAKADTEWLVPLLDAVADNAPLLAEGKDQTFANRLHAALNPAEAEAPARPAKANAAPKKAEEPPEPPAPPDGPLARGLKKLFGR